MVRTRPAACDAHWCHPLQMRMMRPLGNSARDSDSLQEMAAPQAGQQLMLARAKRRGEPDAAASTATMDALAALQRTRDASRLARQRAGGSSGTRSSKLRWSDHFSETPQEVGRCSALVMEFTWRSWCPINAIQS